MSEDQAFPGYLDEKTLEEIRDAVFALGFADDDHLNALANGIAPRFVATYSKGGTPALKLTSLTNRMNITRILSSGEVPLTKWLNNAAGLSAGMPEQMAFKRALEQVSARGTAPTTLAANRIDLAPDVGELPASNGQLEVQIGQDDTLDVGFLHRGSLASQSVAKLIVQRHFNGVGSTTTGNVPDVVLATGWMLAPQLLITNFHVIAARRSYEEPASGEDFRLQGEKAKVIFDLYRDGSRGEVVTSVGCIAYDRDLDYAVLRLGGDDLGRRPLRLRSDWIRKQASHPLRERVNVLQHPEGKPMRLGFRNNFVVAGNEGKLSYLTDTAEGSSGSPICDDEWFVAALHRGTLDISDQPVFVWGKEITQENFGTPIGQILTHLERKFSEVRTAVSKGQAAFTLGQPKRPPSRRRRRPAPDSRVARAPLDPVDPVDSLTARNLSMSTDVVRDKVRGIAESYGAGQTDWVWCQPQLRRELDKIGEQVSVLTAWLSRIDPEHAATDLRYYLSRHSVLSGHLIERLGDLEAPGTGAELRPGRQTEFERAGDSLVELLARVHEELLSVESGHRLLGTAD
jgi:endonuclease G